MPTPSPLCANCNKSPEELTEYAMLAEDEGYDTATEACIREEGTYNRENGHFWCTGCYILIGMPLGLAP